MKNTALKLIVKEVASNDLKIQFMLKHHRIEQHPGIHASWPSSTSSSDSERKGFFSYCEITDPNGNIFDVYCLSKDTEKQQPEAPEEKKAADKILPDGGPGISGPGIAYALIRVHPNALNAIQHYYSTYFQTPTVRHTLTNSTIIEVTVGLTQRLFFSAHHDPDHTEADYEYDPSWHYCIYISAYSETFHRLLADDLIAAFDDRSDHVLTWDSALATKQYRGYHIVDDEAPRTIRLKIEQEIRAASHKHYGRKLINEPQLMPTPD